MKKFYLIIGLLFGLELGYASDSEDLEVCTSDTESRENTIDLGLVEKIIHSRPVPLIRKRIVSILEKYEGEPLEKFFQKKENKSFLKGIENIPSMKFIAKNKALKEKINLFRAYKVCIKKCGYAKKLEIVNQLRSRQKNFYTDQWEWILAQIKKQKEEKPSKEIKDERVRRSDDTGGVKKDIE